MATRHSLLICACFAFMQAVTFALSGMNSEHSRIASGVQACSTLTGPVLGAPWAPAWTSSPSGGSQPPLTTEIPEEEVRRRPVPAPRTMTDLVTSLRQRVLICDGAMGTMLHAAGNSLDRALPELNLSNADLVSTIHESYLSAGADMILTNTFGANRLRLADQGFGEMVREINLAGARIAVRARQEAGRQVFVAGSVSPAVTASQRRRVAREQRVRRSGSRSRR